MRKGISAATASALVSALIVIAPMARAQAACGWHRVRAPSRAGLASVLYGVDARNARDAWAVGESINLLYGGLAANVRALTEHWNGTKWVIVRSPHVIGAQEQLHGVSILSKNNVWAVGWYEIGTTNQSRTLIHHWNGTKWSVVPSPNPSKTKNELHAVDAISANNIWAVGVYTIGSDPRQALIEHWNGKKWSVASHPQSPSNSQSFNDVARIPGQNRAWAVGSDTYYPLIQRSTGTTWADVPSASPERYTSFMNGVVATSGTNAWAVGTDTSGADNRPLVERWNGTSWSFVNAPTVPAEDTNLLAVAASSPGSAWAVGGRRDGSGPERIVSERWNGSKWKITPFPNVGVADNKIGDVAVIPGRNSAWATGYYSDTDKARVLIARWC